MRKTTGKKERALHFRTFMGTFPLLFEQEFQPFYFSMGIVNVASQGSGRRRQKRILCVKKKICDCRSHHWLRNYSVGGARLLCIVFGSKLGCWMVLYCLVGKGWCGGSQGGLTHSMITTGHSFPRPLCSQSAKWR